MVQFSRFVSGLFQLHLTLLVCGPAIIELLTSCSQFFARVWHASHLSSRSKACPLFANNLSGPTLLWRRYRETTVDPEKARSIWDSFISFCEVRPNTSFRAFIGLQIGYKLITVILINLFYCWGKLGIVASESCWQNDHSAHAHHKLKRNGSNSFCLVQLIM
jgi:hypothetical protein